MAKRIRKSLWSKSFQRALNMMTRSTLRIGTQAFSQAAKTAISKRKAPAGAGEWISGLAIGITGARQHHLFRPANVVTAERLPLLVMLHGCGQDAKSFALSTRMNRIAARERFLVLYPEQDRKANPQGCWNWYGTRSKRAYGEAAILMAAIDQVCLLYPVNPASIAIAGMSAGASMAALLVTLHPERFKAIVMHSGIPPGTAHSPVSALRAMRGHSATLAPASNEVWPPLLVIHGSADRVVSASNGQASVQLWTDAAGAQTGKSRRVKRGGRYETTVTDFKAKGSAVATLCEVEGLGHAWSGGDAKRPFGDARGPDASRMTWAFVARQFRATR